MKKAALILLSSIYLLSVCGISVNRFYCCGILQSSGVSAAVFNNEHKKDDGCCKHTQTILKVSDSHENVQTAQASKITAVDFCAGRLNCHPASLHSFTAHKNFINGPPIPPTAVPLYIQLCIYRI